MQCTFLNFQKRTIRQNNFFRNFFHFSIDKITFVLCPKSSNNAKYVCTNYERYKRKRKDAYAKSCWRGDQNFKHQNLTNPNVLGMQ